MKSLIILLTIITNPLLGMYCPAEEPTKTNTYVNLVVTINKQDKARYGIKANGKTKTEIPVITLESMTIDTNTPHDKQYCSFNPSFLPLKLIKKRNNKQTCTTLHVGNYTNNQHPHTNTALSSLTKTDPTTQKNLCVKTIIHDTSFSSCTKDHFFCPIIISYADNAQSNQSFEELLEEKLQEFDKKPCFELFLKNPEGNLENLLEDEVLCIDPYTKRIDHGPRGYATINELKKLEKAYVKNPSLPKLLKHRELTGSWKK